LKNERKDFLLEIGMEELPPAYIVPAARALGSSLEDALKEAYPDCEEASLYTTPRRIAVFIRSLPVRQEDKSEIRVGPAMRIAYDENGELTKAGAGFARACGVDKEQLKVLQTDKGEYISAEILVKGKDTKDILQKAAHEALTNLSFPRSMRWNDKKTKFARPIRWLVALLGDELIDLKFGTVKADRYTYGNITGKKPEAIKIENIRQYPELLKKSFVLVDREQRRELIEEQVARLAEDVSGKVVWDDGLLDEITDITEYPTAVLAEFAKDYLQLPPRIINSTLAKNQKYVTISDDRDNLLNKFVFLANNLPEYAPETKLGNEKVVKARLDDALFYYNEDIAKSIEYFNNKLNNVLFQEKLGSVKEKTTRLIRICQFICSSLNINSQQWMQIERAAEICKFDLATAMIAEKEFTSLQGYMGHNYAKVWGEEEEVALAIEEHYQPIAMNDQIPSEMTGIVVSLADKMDTLCGIFSIGKIPTGSNDPYALRRAANGIVRILLEKELSLDLRQLMNTGMLLIENKLREVERESSANKTKETSEDKTKENIEKATSALWEFFGQRIDWLLQQKGIDYDIRNSVLAGDYSDLIRVWKSAAALSSVRNRDDFRELILSFKRVSNIIAAEKTFGNFRMELAIEAAEKELHNETAKLDVIVRELIAKYEYEKTIEHFIGLKDSIDKFFDEVLVNVPEVEIRNNRYSLLNKIREIFLNVGDLSLIVIQGEK